MGKSEQFPARARASDRAEKKFPRLVPGNHTETERATRGRRERARQLRGRLRRRPGTVPSDSSSSRRRPLSPVVLSLRSRTGGAGPFLLSRRTLPNPRLGRRQDGAGGRIGRRRRRDGHGGWMGWSGAQGRDGQGRDGQGRDAALRSVSDIFSRLDFVLSL